jgi:hypothetical protein
MDLGDFVFFIIFIIIIVSNIVKQVRKQKKVPDAQPAETKTGWKKTFEDILKDVRTQMEQSDAPSPMEPSRRPSGWEDLILVENEERQIPKKEDQQTAVKMRSKPISEAPGRESDFDELRVQGLEVEKRDKGTRRTKERDFPRVTKRQLSARPSAARVSETNLSVEDLKNAMIWHEILSPPVGLREIFK